jgi:phosphomannomutase
VGPDGIFLDTAAGTRVRDLAAGESLSRASYSAIGSVTADPNAISRHLAAVLALRGVAVRAIRRRRFRVALDTVRGAGGAVMPELLERLGCRVTAINLETDGLFPRPPEPVPENLKALGALVRRKKADIGIAVDPDVDRLAIVDEKGRPIGEDYTLAFAVRAVRPSGRQTVVCNLSTSLVVEDAAREFGATIVRTQDHRAEVADRW